MSQNNHIEVGMPPAAAAMIRHLGERVRIARKRRRLTMAEMASRMFVTRKTLARLENGEPGVSLAVFFSAFWVLGLEKELEGIGAPEHDEVGAFLEQQRLPRRVRAGETEDDLNF